MWEMVKLSEVIEKQITGEWGDGEGETKILRTTNFNNDGSLDLSNVVERNIPANKIVQKALVFGDSIIEKPGGSPTQPVGRVVYFNVENDVFLCNNFTSVIRPKASVNPKYLFWFLFNNHLIGNTLKYQNKTTGIINLQLDRYLKEIEMPLPPLSIQQKIATILDKADALRRKDQALVKKYDDLAQAIFIDMFGDPVKNDMGWEVRKLGEVCDKITDGTHLSPKFQNTGIPFLFVSNIVNNKIIYETDTFISEEEFEVLVKRTPIEIENILLTTVGSYGNPAIIEKLDKFSFQRHIAFLKPNHNIIDYKFLFGLLKSPFVKHQIDRKVRGVAQKTLNLSELKEIEIWLPAMALQKEYSQRLDNLTQQRDMTLILAKKSESLFQSLLQQAFKGELV